MSISRFQAIISEISYVIYKSPLKSGSKNGVFPLILDPKIGPHLLHVVPKPYFFCLRGTRCHQNYTLYGYTI